MPTRALRRFTIDTATTAKSEPRWKLGRSGSIGKHLNMFVDRKAIEISYTDDSDAYLARLLELVQAPVLEHGPQQLKQLEHDAKEGQEYGPTDDLEPDCIDITA